MVYFGFNLPSNSEQKFESSASLRSAMWFILASISCQIQSKNSRALPRFARPCGFIIFCSISVKFEVKNRELCFASLGHVDYFGFNLQSNSEQKFESSASLRSAMWFVLASTPDLPSNSNQNFESSASLRSAMWFFCFNLLLYSGIFSCEEEKMFVDQMKNVFRM